ncbi:hypothetical protein M426DRAFT_320606 [Hypoxylon sp. CI-4A]|nr:hypothetical protein M426DRAFT_320606 [Hypoxylon sp. CI-4A]
MELESYSLAEVLAVANIHPFYVPDIQYPPDARTIQAVRKLAKTLPTEVTVDLKLQPLLQKKGLYSTIKRLIDDVSPRNTYRQSIYASTTGGGFSLKPLFFATDVFENRRQRAYFGHFLRATGVISPKDWILTVHSAGELYRSLDLTLEISENAGASVLSAGNHMSPADVSKLLAEYHVNVLAGDSSQVTQIAHYISTLPQTEQDQIKLDKIIYTSETLTVAQRMHIKATLGPIKICSIFGSAEAGPWAVSSPDLSRGGAITSQADFVFDTRATQIEIMSPAIGEHDSTPCTMPEGESGLVAQTSLMRLRNPLVRYMTGDVGSLHPLPEHARSLVSKSDWPYLRVLRLEGRDRRFSFEWDGEYIEFEGLSALMDDAQLGVLQWQVALDKMEPSQEASLQIRLLCSPRKDNDALLPEEALVGCIRTYFHVYAANEHRFQITFANGLGEFEKSSTGRKVIKFVDRYSS